MNKAKQWCHGVKMCHRCHTVKNVTYATVSTSVANVIVSTHVTSGTVSSNVTNVMVSMCVANVTVSINVTKDEKLTVWVSVTLWHLSPKDCPALLMQLQPKVNNTPVTAFNAIKASVLCYHWLSIGKGILPSGTKYKFRCLLLLRECSQAIS